VSLKRAAALLAGRLMDGESRRAERGVYAGENAIAASELFDVRPEWLQPLAPSSAC
jgi:hypothetical protein